MKDLVLYHDNCADGFCAAWCAWLVLGDAAEYIPVKCSKNCYAEIKDKCSDCKVFVLDFSFSKAETEDLISRAAQLVWLDHHKTAFENWCGWAPDDDRSKYFEGLNKGGLIILDNDRSGAALAWDWFQKNQSRPHLVNLVDDRDRWQFKIDGSRELNAAIWSYLPWTFKQWSENFEGNTKQLIVEGAAILRAHDANVRSVVAGGRTLCEVLQIKGLACNCPPHLVSDAGHELAIESRTYGLCWCLAPDGITAKVSLRSNGDFDVSAIAKMFPGGGGHKNAAGFEVPIEQVLSWMQPL